MDLTQADYLTNLLVSDHSLAGLGVEPVGLWLRQFCPIGGREDHPVTEVCGVRGHPCYHWSLSILWCVLYLVTDLI